MRAILTALAFTAAGFVTVPAARAEITYPWCLGGSNKDGARNCGYLTFAQCATSARGSTYCEPNPMYRPDLPPRRAR